MASWRETTSETAQNDLDALLNAVLPFAQQSIGRYGEFLPFGATVGLDGQIALAAAGAELGEQRPSQQVLDLLYDGARHRTDGLRAAAFVADVLDRGGDAIRVELEHREGAALVLLQPYSRRRFGKKVTLGQMSVGAGDRRIWVD